MGLKSISKTVFFLSFLAIEIALIVAPSTFTFERCVPVAQTHFALEINFLSISFVMSRMDVLPVNQIS